MSRRIGAGMLRRDGEVRGGEFLLDQPPPPPVTTVCLLVTGDQAVGQLLLSGDLSGNCEGISGDQR